MDAKMDTRPTTRHVDRERKPPAPQPSRGAKQIVIPMTRTQYDEGWHNPFKLARGIGLALFGEGPAAMRPEVKHAPGDARQPEHDAPDRGGRGVEQIQSIRPVKAPIDAAFHAIGPACLRSVTLRSASDGS